MYYKINICICADRQNLVNNWRNFFFERLKQSIEFMGVLIHFITVGYRRNAQRTVDDMSDPGIPLLPPGGVGFIPVDHFPV